MRPTAFYTQPVEGGTEPETIDLDLAEVSRTYAEGGEPLVRHRFQLSRFDDLDAILARALAAHPLEYEDIEVVEGVHDGLVARAHRAGLRSGDPAERKAAVDRAWKRKGLLKDERAPGEVVAEALVEFAKLMRGERPLPEGVIEVKELPPAKVGE